MIIETQEDVTKAVLAEMHRTPDPRTAELLELLVRHLHAFVRALPIPEGARASLLALTPASELIVFQLNDKAFTQVAKI